jgi:hypothetical protein
MYGRVDEKLFVKKHDKVLNCTQDFRLDAKGSVGFAQLDECPEHVWIGTRIERVSFREQRVAYRS